MRAGQADHIIVIPHQVAPGLRAFHHRYAQLMRADDLRIIVMYRGSADDERSALHIFRLMLIADFCAPRLQARGNVSPQPVRAGDRHPF